MDDVILAAVVSTIVATVVMTSIMTLIWWWSRSDRDCLEDDQHDYLLGNAILTAVSNELGRDWINLGREMGLSQAAIERIELDQARYGSKEMASVALITWRKQNGMDASKDKLMEHLKSIERKDIVHKISTMPPGTKKMKSQPFPEPFIHLFGRLRCQKLKRNLQRQYKKLRLKGLPWMRNVVLTLEQHFVELEIIQESKDRIGETKIKIQLEQLFPPEESFWTRWFSHSKPSRILVEGGAGYGKTTLALKLCHDYGNQQSYLRYFDLVLHIFLRNFEGNLEAILNSSAFTKERTNGSILKMINNKSIRTLLILDGWDELPSQHDDYILSLIKGEILPHISLLVTSRPGKFTSSMKGDVGQFKHMGPDCYLDVVLPWDKCTKIIGISVQRQEEFIEKCLMDLTKDEKLNINDKLTRMTKMKILMPDFLQCPLFLLMVILLLIGERNINFQHLRTRTQLYKRVMNFIIRRYLTKINDPSASKADLFSFDFDHRPFYIDLMSQLGEFSLLFAVHKNSLSFSKEDVLGSTLTRDTTILDLGILTKTVKMVGILEEEFYEPVHKSLLEFVAAYYLWIQYRMGPSDEWKKNILKIRPSFDSADSSLVFIFFIGLMGDGAGSIFNMLTPYASEYTSYFESLIPSLSETNMTDKLLLSLRPFLPFSWKIYWWKSDILSSLLPPQIMEEGIKQRILKELRWNLDVPVCSPCDIEVDILKIQIYDGMSPLSKDQTKRIKCRSLECQFVSTESARNKWNDLLSYFSFIQFQCISFYFRDASTTSVFLPLIWKEFTMGELKYAEMQYLNCIYSEGMGDVMDILTVLIHQEIVAALQLQLDFMPEREKLDFLFSSISKSMNLTTFVLINNQASNFVVVDLGELCDGGKKVYEWLFITNAIVKCKPVLQEPNFKIMYLNLSEAFVPFFNNLWQVASFASKLLFPCDVLHESLTELTVKVEHTFDGNKIFSHVSKFRHLKHLCLILSEFEYQSTSVDNPILNFMEYLPLLKGVEICSIEDNILLANDLVEGIVNYLARRSSLPESSTSSPVANLGNDFYQLEYLCFYTEIDPDINDPSPSDSSKMEEIISLLLQLKKVLSEKSLTRVDIVVTYNTIFLYMSKFKPHGFSSFVEIFSTEEGFDVQYDMTGMRKDDPLHWKLKRETFGISYERFSVR